MITNLTIVIPAKNEEANISNLLADLSIQEGIEDIKIYLADAKSTDNTVMVAKYLAEAHGLDLEVIPGGLPAHGRNAGARKADTRYVLFLDSDIRITDTSLIAECLALAESKDAWLVTTNTFCDSDSKKSRFVYWLSSQMQVVSKYVWKPFSTGMFMLVNRNAFINYGMFDEDVTFCEDYLFSVKIPRKRFNILKDSAIYTSDRRLKKEGHFGMIWLSLKTTASEVVGYDKFFHKNHNYW